MKKILLFILCAFSISLFAQNSATTDHLTVTNVTLSSDGTAGNFTVSLDGSDIYCAYNLDIQLPQGVSVQVKNDKLNVSMVKSTSGIYPYTEDVDDDDNTVYTYEHNISCSMIANNTLRIACLSNSNAVFRANSGKLFRVYLTASAYAKPSLNDIHISGQYLTKADGSSKLPADVTYSNITVSPTQVSLPLTISASNKWTTCVLPFDAAIPTGVVAYKSNGISNNQLHLSSVEAFAAYTPYLVYAENGFSGNVSGTPSESAYNNKVTNGVADATGVLRGAIATQSLSSGYVLQNQGSGAKFYNIYNETFVINPGKCWIVVPTGSQAPAIDLTTEELTAVEDVECTDDSDAPIYNIYGMQVSEMIPGQIYIQNGKKFLKL